MQAFGALTVVYLVVTACLSWFKLMWMDEQITVHIAALGSPSAIWKALAAGADPNPPLTHLLVLLCSRLFGAHTYVFRIPAIVGYWVGMLSLFLYLRRRTTPTWALLGTVISMGMAGFEWSYESRSYALFYGTTMAALLFWSYAADSFPRPGRWKWIAALALALATGLCCNYFSVLAFVPIALGELTATLERRNLSGTRPSVWSSVDLSVWCAMAVALFAAGHLPPPHPAFHRAVRAVRLEQGEV